MAQYLGWKSGEVAKRYMQRSDAYASLTILERVFPRAAYGLATPASHPDYLDTAILTAYIISPSRGKDLSSSNSGVLQLRASSIMYCDLRFKYHSFSHLVVSSKEFAEVTVKFRPRASTSPGGGPCCILHLTRILPWQSRVSSHNLVSRVRAIVCSENVLLFELQTF